LVSEADSIILKGINEPIFANDVLTCKISGKNAPGTLKVDRIIYGGVVLNGVYYQSDKIQVKTRSLPEIDDEVQEIKKIENIKKNTAFKSIKKLDVKKEPLKKRKRSSLSDSDSEDNVEWITKY